MNKNIKKLFMVLFAFVMISFGQNTVYAQELQQVSEDAVEKPEDLNQVNIDIDTSELEENIYEDIETNEVQSLFVQQYDWKKYSSDFYYNEMTTDQQIFYDRLDEMVLAYMNSTLMVDGSKYTPSGKTVSSVRMPSVSYSDLGISKDEAKQLYWIFNYSNPQYFFLSNVLAAGTTDGAGYVAPYVYEIFADGAIRQQYVTKFNQQISDWCGEIGSQANDYLLEKKIHDVICDKVTYEPQTENIGNPYYQSVISALCNDGTFSNVTVCAGYAKAFSLFANYYGLETLEVTSTTHAWNKVFLYDNWYNIDCTWDDQTSGKIYNYFNKNDTYFVSSGHNPESFWPDYTPAADNNFNSVSGIKANFVNQPQIITRTADGGKLVSFKKRKDTDAIYYTLDGSAATTASTSFSDSFMVSTDTQVNAIEVEAGVGTSSQASLDVSVKAAENPSLSTSGNTVTITSKQDGADFYYTMDGSDPTTASMKYTVPFTVSDGQTVKAAAYKRGYARSAVVSNYYKTSLDGICYIMEDDRIDVGTAYTSNDPGLMFQWKSYNLTTKKWELISDWSSGNWASWKPKKGNYWLHVEAKGSNGDSKESTLCFSAEKDYSQTLSLDGICYIYQNDRIDVGTAYSSSLDGTQFQWKAYNLDTGVWETIADWNNGNWASWRPAVGNYWLHVEAKNSDGCSAQRTINFRVDTDYKNMFSLDGICYITQDDRIDIGTAYTCSDPDVTFQWKSYNLDTGVWEMIADWNNGNWASWRPAAGNYWLHVEAKNSAGEVQQSTTCFYTEKSYQ